MWEREARGNRQQHVCAKKRMDARAHPKVIRSLSFGLLDSACDIKNEWVTQKYFLLRKLLFFVR